MFGDEEYGNHFNISAMKKQIRNCLAASNNSLRVSSDCKSFLLDLLYRAVSLEMEPSGEDDAINFVTNLEPRISDTYDHILPIMGGSVNHTNGDCVKQVCMLIEGLSGFSGEIKGNVLKMEVLLDLCGKVRSLSNNGAG